MSASTREILFKGEDTPSTGSLQEVPSDKDEESGDKLIDQIERAMLERKAPYGEASHHLEKENDDLAAARSSKNSCAGAPELAIARGVLPTYVFDSTETDEAAERQDTSETASKVRLSSRKLHNPAATEEELHANADEEELAPQSTGDLAPFPRGFMMKLTDSRSRVESDSFPPTIKGSMCMKVALRIRPLLKEEVTKGATVIVNKTDDRTVLLVDPTNREGAVPLSGKKPSHKQRVLTHKYSFDWAFDERSPQDEVYSRAVKPLVQNVLEGYNSCVFAYGATGTGKTYTMVGNEGCPGIMVRSFDDLFDNPERQDASVYLSYLEIYNENIRDLLSTWNDNLELREDPNDGYYAVGLSEVQCMSSKEVLRLLQRGNKRRTVEATAANQTSSRSHALLKVTIKQSNGNTNKFGKMFMVDLAGTERTSNTNATGKRLKEGAHINKSLLALGNVINALAMKSAKHVNFRDSKLTRLLKEALGGNCRTLMVAHISPVPSAYEESRNTLVYADRAKNITMKIRSNLVDVNTNGTQYQGIITELRAEIHKLQDKIEQNEKNNVKILPVPISNGHVVNKKIEGENLKDVQEINKLRKQLVESFNKQMMVRSKMMEVDNCLLALSTDLEKLSIVINQWETEKLKTEEGGEPVEEEPDYVKQAWEDVEFIQGEQQRFLQLREDIEKEFEDARDKTYELTEKLPHVVTTEDQRELLRLLTQCHKLEVEKIEMQTDQLIREHELRQRDLMIVRYDRQRLLSDEIIIKQKQLIEDFPQGNKRGRARTVQAVKELNDLYRIYQQEVQDLSNGRDTVLKHLNTNPYRAESVLGLRPLGSSESMWELNHMEPLNEEGDDGQPRNDTAPPGFSRRTPLSTESMNRITRLPRKSYSEPVSPASVNFPPVDRNNFVGRNGGKGEGGGVGGGDDIEKGTRRINSVAQERRNRASATSRMYSGDPRCGKHGDQEGCQIQ